MKIKNKTLVLGIVILIIVFLLFQINFINSQELTEITEISSQEFSYYGENVELIDDSLVCKTGFEKCKIEIRKGDITTTIEATPGIKISPLGKISVVESGSEFSLNGNSFSNIQSGDIIIDQSTGAIKNADFLTNADGGKYNLNENEFNVPGNKKFVYSSTEGIYQLPDGAEVLEAQKNIQIKTLKNEFIEYKGNKISGILNFDENGNMLVRHTGAGETKFNNVDIKISGAKEETQGVNIFTSLEEAKISGVKNYVIFGNEFNVNLGDTKKSGNVHIKFKEENSYVGVGENGLFEITAGKRANEISSSITIKKGTDTELPIVDNKGFRILNDHTSSNIKFGAQGEAESVSINKYDSGKGKEQVPMLVRNQLNKKYNEKEIQIASLYSDKAEKIYFTSNLDFQESVKIANALKYEEYFKPETAKEIPFMQDVFEKNVVVTIDTVAMIDDKDFIAKFQDYKSSYKGLRSSQKIYEDKYFQEEYLTREKYDGQAELVYNEAKKIVNDPSNSFTDINNKLSELYKDEFLIDYFPTLENPDPNFKTQVRDIVEFYYEAEKSGPLPSGSSQFSLAQNEKIKVDYLVNQKGYSLSDAIDEVLKIGPKVMFSDPNIPAQKWWGMFKK
ncbi:MAG: hypothetical protein AABY06_02465 [Nanoarchaeota archaeon]